jgi:hypothetical protein
MNLDNPIVNNRQVDDEAGLSFSTFDNAGDEFSAESYHLIHRLDWIMPVQRGVSMHHK